jgi:hypothetical protein
MIAVVDHGEACADEPKPHASRPITHAIVISANPSMIHPTVIGTT